NVGNAVTSTASATAKVDTTAPSAPSLTLSESSPLEHVSGTTLYYNPQGGNSGSFTVAATSVDGQSGIAKLNVPAISGMTGGGDDATGPYGDTYGWTSSTSASGPQSVAATNNAGLETGAAFTLAPD